MKKLTKHMNPINRRGESRTLAGQMKGAYLYPLNATPVLGSERGMFNQKVVLEMEPVAGRLLSEVTAHVITIYVPTLATDVLKNDTDQYAGMADAFRAKVNTSDVLFDLEAETDISKYAGIVPRHMPDGKKVSEKIRLAYIAAANYLARRLHVSAVQYDKTKTSLVTALLGSTVLDRFNGVLDPEDNINGAVDLTGTIPVRGAGFIESTQTGSAQVYSVREPGDTAPKNMTGWAADGQSAAGHVTLFVKRDDAVSYTPDIYAEFTGDQSLSIKEFYAAEMRDRITRELRAILDQNPELGEEMILNITHGLSVDTGAQPFIMYEREWVLNSGVQRAMDGPNLDKLNTNLAGGLEYTVPIPQTEFGGVIITLAQIKPDESVDAQPHPLVSHPEAAINFKADELAIDPEPVQVRDLYGDCDLLDAETRVMYAARNELKRNYVQYGFNRMVDPNAIASKNSIWTYSVPLSVTPELVYYPEDFQQYPWGNQIGPICTYTCATQASIQTPLIYGPTPLEELPIIETENIFGEEA